MIGEKKGFGEGREMEKAFNVIITLYSRLLAVVYCCCCSSRVDRVYLYTLAIDISLAAQQYSSETLVISTLPVRVEIYRTGQ